MLRVGLTGGIASGKTLVATMLGEFGAQLVDSDQIARAVVKPGEPALAALTEALGDSILTSEGELDRRAVRALVFADEAKRRQLEAVLHPAIRSRMLDRMDALAESIETERPTYILAVVPLLVETGFAEHVDRVLLVDCPEELQLERLMQRDDMSRGEAEAMIAAQADAERRRAAADDIIDNSRSIAWTRAQAWRRHLAYLNS